MLGMSTPSMAQEVDYNSALKSIVAAFEAAPNDPKAGKDLVKKYQKTFKKDEKALVALVIFTYHSVITMLPQR